MRVLLDDAPLSIDRPTLACALETGIGHAQQAGRVVIEIKLNGVALTDDQLAAPSDEESPGAEVTMTTAEPVALVRETLIDGRDALAEAIALQKASAEMLHAGQTKDALKAVGETLGLWQAVQQVVQQTTKVVGATPQTLTLEPPAAGEAPVPLATRVEELAATLIEIRDAMREGDTARLADALEYDLVEKAELWRTLLHNFAKALTTEPADG
jgi:hypothetical protein